MKTDDLVSVFYKIKQTKLDLANALLDRADAEETMGRRSHAATFRMQAQSIIEHETNYEPRTISRVVARAESEALTTFNARFVKADMSSEAKVTLREEVITVS